MKKLCVLAALTVGLCSPALADSVGARVAVGQINTDTKEDFDAYELFAVFDLPWAWDQEASRIQSQIEITGGVLDGGGESGFWGTVGPRIAFITDNVSFDLGAGVAGVGKKRFGRHNFGGSFQFTAQAGLDFALTERLQAGVRIRHMSDGSTHEEGQDLNLIFLEILYDFTTAN